MIIIMSPSKTQSLKKDRALIETIEREFGVVVRKEPQPQLLKKLTTASKSTLSRLLQIDGKLLDKTFEIYRSFEMQESNFAIAMYTGSVFQGLELDSYSTESLRYLQQHVVILSAFYGVVKPFDLLRPYRLDMNHSVLKKKNADFWTKDFEHLSQSGIIINLASDEFSQTVHAPMIDIVFMESTTTGPKIKSTYAKIARGKMAHYLISNQITDPERIKQFDLGGYTYSETDSDTLRWVFIR